MVIYNIWMQKTTQRITKLPGLLTAIAYHLNSIFLEEYEGRNLHDVECFFEGELYFFRAVIFLVFSGPEED